MFGFLKRLLGAEDVPRPSADTPPAPPRTGPSLGLEVLAQRLGVLVGELVALQPTYRTFQIPKRSGGMRTILAPEDRLKEIQRRILRRLLAKLESDASAKGFERGESIVTHAMEHVGKAVVIRLDLKDFFTSVTARRIKQYFGVIGWQDEVAELLTRLVTHEGALPQGAPTSPRLSNLVNRRLDWRLRTLALCHDANYSRYADDITFSADVDRVKSLGRINDLIHIAKEIIASEGYTMHIHKKLRIARSHHQQLVTGLVVNRKVNLPRTTRRWLRAIEHHLTTGQPATMTKDQLAGWRSLQAMIRTQSAS